jgi:hypothetical protein
MVWAPLGKLPTYHRAMKTTTTLMYPLDSSPSSDILFHLLISVGRRKALPPHLCQMCALPPDVHRRGRDVPHR